MQYNDYYDYDYVPQPKIIKEQVVVQQPNDDKFFLYFIILLLICTIIIMNNTFQNKYAKLLEKHIKVI